MSAPALAALLTLVLYVAPVGPTPIYMTGVVEFCANIYSIDAENCWCIVESESEWNPNARGDDGEAAGLWQWHEESIRYAFDDMGVYWDWTEDGDPRLNVWASTLAACHALSKGWDWWTTQEMCDAIT